MEEKDDKNDNNDVVNKAQSETKININKHIEELHLRSSDEAGPSNVIDIPGTINPGIFNKTVLPGISKSEVNIRQILTNNEGGTTIALTSLSFGNQRVIPQEENLQNMIDLKNFITSCLNTPDTTVKEIINIPVIITEKVQVEQPNVVVTINEEIESRNESGAIVPKVGTVSKVASDSSKRKTSGDISQRSGMGLTQRDSLSSIGSNVCRICMTRGREKLISPCNCKGSLANVHLSCLERWLNQVGRNHCELCGFSYPAIRTPRYTVLQALRLWFGNPRNRSHLQSDCLIFWLLSTVTAGLLAVCVVGTQYFVIEGKKIGKHDGGALRKDEGGISHRITETAMNFFMAIVLCGYFVTVYLLWKDHYVMWNRWRRANVNVRLLLTPDSNPVPFIPRSEYNI